MVRTNSSRSPATPAVTKLTRRSGRAIAISLYSSLRKFGTATFAFHTVASQRQSHDIPGQHTHFSDAITELQDALNSTGARRGFCVNACTKHEPDYKPFIACARRTLNRG